VTPAERTLRTSPVTGIRLDPLLTAVLLAELLDPSDELWLVSAWVSDVAAIDNTRGDYESLFADASARVYPLAEILALLTGAGTHLTIVTRPDEHNDAFLGRLRHRADPRNWRLAQHADVHEKTLCGRNWLVTGSMNFTLRGMQVNDEAVTYRFGEAAAAQARIDFARRWGAQP
jgi:phosphatidylserine/phosphatidylglycerophosphate/cardiolipin synthase-like enzyme